MTPLCAALCSRCVSDHAVGRRAGLTALLVDARRLPDRSVGLAVLQTTTWLVATVPASLPSTSLMLLRSRLA